MRILDIGFKKKVLNALLKTVAYIYPFIVFSRPTDNYKIVVMEYLDEAGCPRALKIWKEREVYLWFFFPISFIIDTYIIISKERDIDYYTSLRDDAIDVLQDREKSIPVEIEAIKYDKLGINYKNL